MCCFPLCQTNTTKFEIDDRFCVESIMFLSPLKSDRVIGNGLLNKRCLLLLSMRAKWITSWLHLGWITCYKDVKLYWETAKDFGSLPLTLFGFRAEQMAEHGLLCRVCDEGWVSFRFYRSWFGFIIEPSSYWTVDWITHVSEIQLLLCLWLASMTESSLDWLKMFKVWDCGQVLERLTKYWSIWFTVHTLDF